MRRLIPLAMMTGCCVFAAACDDDMRSPQRLVFPVVQDNSVPAGPTIIDTITSDVWYVIQSDSPLIILQVPDGLLTITEETGPLKIRGRFADSTGVETRLYAGKHIYSLEPRETGKTELLVIPVGVQTSGEIAMQPLTVVDGTGPNPPPKPDPPKPDKVEAITLAIVEDVTARTPEIAITMAAIEGWQMPTGSSYRRYDKTTSEGEGQLAVAALAGRALPGIVIRNKANGAVIHKGLLPSFDDLKKLVGSFVDE